MFLAMIIAVRQALDYESMERTVGVCLIGWFLHIVNRRDVEVACRSSEAGFPPL